MKGRKHTDPLLFGMSELDLWHHAVLVLLFIVGFFAMLYVSPSKIFQLVIGVCTASMYVVWGIIHHYYDNDLHFKSVVEYLLIAVLGVVILAGVLL